MRNESRHASFVDAWLSRLTRDFPQAQPVELLDRALSALWRRSHVTLGEITLTAIVNRVVHTGRDKFPWLSRVKVETTGVSLGQLQQNGGTTSDADTAAGLRFLLVEFLTVIGNLTGEILTPELHAELDQMVIQKSPDRDEPGPAPHSGRRKKGGQAPNDE